MSIGHQHRHLQIAIPKVQGERQRHTNEEKSTKIVFIHILVDPLAEVRKVREHGNAVPRHILLSAGTFFQDSTRFFSVKKMFVFSRKVLVRKSSLTYLWKAHDTYGI